MKTLCCLMVVNEDMVFSAVENESGASAVEKTLARS